MCNGHVKHASTFRGLLECQAGHQAFLEQHDRTARTNAQNLMISELKLASNHSHKTMLFQHVNRCTMPITDIGKFTAHPVFLLYFISLPITVYHQYCRIGLEHTLTKHCKSPRR
jgi:hypothetical protein